MNLYTYTNEFIQKELEMFFSDYENDFTHAMYTVSRKETGKAIYSLTLNETYSNFATELAPQNVFKYVTQIVDDVREVIYGAHGINYKNWNDVVFSRDTTFDTSYFDAPEPTIVFMSQTRVGSLGKVLLCLSGNDLSLRDLKGRIFDDTIADINEMNNARYSYRSLGLSAMPKAYFKENTRLRAEDASLWEAHEDNEDAISDLSTRLDDAVDYLQQEHEANVQDIRDLERQFESGGEVYVLKTDHQALRNQVDGIQNKVNEMYPRTVGDDSLLSQNYRKTLRNEINIFDQNLKLYGGTDPQTQEELEGDIPELKRRVGATETTITDHETRITANRTDIDDIMAYPEFNMSGIPPFYCFRRGDFTSISNRAYDPVLWEDTVSAGTPATTSELQWLHVAEKRIKEMPLRIMRDPEIKASAQRICTEANNGTTGKQIPIGSYVNEFRFFADSPANWTVGSTYTAKQIMCNISIVPAKWGGNAFKPALLFEISTGHLDGGSAAGDCTGMFVLMDKSDTNEPDYHWYRYGDTVNVNGLAMANVKIQYH